MPISNNTLEDEALAWLKGNLPKGWRVHIHGALPSRKEFRPEAVGDLTGPDGSTTRLVIALRDQLEPRAVAQLAEQMTAYSERYERAVCLVVSPFWLFLPIPLKR